jgi:hypothetical protein
MATSQVGGLVVWNNTSATQVTEPTSTGIVYSTAGLASYIPKGGYDPVTDLVYVDDFFTGASTSPDIAQGWALGGGSASNVASEANHPGIINVSTTSTQNTISNLTGRTNQTTGTLDPATTFDMTWIVRASADSTNISMKIGMSDNMASTTPSNGIYVERLGGDTSWFGVTRSGGSQTRTAALITSAAATWFKFRIRRVNGSTVGFTVNALTEVTATATIPTAQMQPGILITNPAAAAATTIDIDLFALSVSGLTR